METENKENKENQNQDGTERLIMGMEKVAEYMKKYYSYKYSFFRGMFYGLGFLLGTTIVAGILLTVANQFFDDIPFQTALENKIMNK